MTRPRAQDRPADDSLLPPTASNTHVLDGLTRAIRYADDFALLFAICNSNRLRSDLLRRLHKSLEDKTIVEVGLRRPEKNLYRLLAERLSSKKSGRASEVVMVYGLEAWLPAGPVGENTPFVKNLNVTRNLFAGLFSGALVLWLSPHHLDVISAGAPDFCSVHSGIYAFTSAREQFDESDHLLDALGLDGAAGLSFEERRHRAEEYDRLLEALYATPETERDQRRERRLLKAASETYFSLAEYGRAEELLRRRLELEEATGDSDPRGLVAALNNLAVLLNRLGRPRDAELLLERALAIDETTGESHSLRNAVHLANRAESLRRLGRPAEAEQLVRRALAIREESGDGDQPETATTLVLLASILTEAGREAEAEVLLQRALTIMEAFQLTAHPRYASGLAALAGVLVSTNRLAEAEQLLKRALAIDEKSYGPRHPVVAGLRHRLETLHQLMQQ